MPTRDKKKEIGAASDEISEEEEEISEEEEEEEFSEEEGSEEGSEEASDASEEEASDDDDNDENAAADSDDSSGGDSSDSDYDDYDDYDESDSGESSGEPCEKVLFKARNMAKNGEMAPVFVEFGAGFAEISEAVATGLGIDEAEIALMEYEGFDDADDESIPTPLRGRSDARRLMKQVARHAPKNVKIAVFCCQKGVLGEKIEKSAKRGAKMAENGPKMAENVPKMAPKMAERAPRMAENAPRMAPGMAENAPKMAERATKMAPGHCGAPPARWARGEILGKGAAGRVYRGMDMETGRLMAVKIIPAPDPAARAAIMREIATMAGLGAHPNVVGYIGAEESKQGPATLSLFLELFPGGSLSSLLGKFGKLPERVAGNYVGQALRGLAYLHGKGLVHRDVKGGNLLVDASGRVALADFGCARVVRPAAIKRIASGLSELEIAEMTPKKRVKKIAAKKGAKTVKKGAKTAKIGAKTGKIGAKTAKKGAKTAKIAKNDAKSDKNGAKSDKNAEKTPEKAEKIDDEIPTDLKATLAGTPLFMAPETIRGSPPAPCADIWALGCTLIEMLTAEAPWRFRRQNSTQIALPENDFSALFAIASHEITPEYPENISKNCADFLERCLQRDPELRATAAELEKMPFVTGS